MQTNSSRVIRTQITEWDWHYRVGFDSNLAQNISIAFTKISHGSERQMELQELEHYQSIISLDCLISHALQSPHCAEAFLETSKGKQLLFLPDQLASSLIATIATTSKLNDKLKKGLEELVYAATKEVFANHAGGLVETALGKGFLEKASYHLKNFQGDLKNAQEEVKDICGNEITGLLKFYQEAIINHGKSLFPPGLLINPVFQAHVSSSLGCFAEYWPHLITEKPNTLILSDLLGYESRQDIIGTFVHEIGGHACFYDLASKNACRFIDHGAMCLIEGWATWVEWNSPFANTLYKKKLLSNALFSISISSETDASKAEGKIRAIYGSEAQQDPKLHQSLTNFYQYPGLSLSYHAGASWFDMRFKNDSPAEFWEKNWLNPFTNILSSFS